MAEPGGGMIGCKQEKEQEGQRNACCQFLSDGSRPCTPFSRRAKKASSNEPDEKSKPLASAIPYRS